MSPTVAVAVRFPHHHSLAASWDVLAGTLALPEEMPPAGSPILVDGRVGDVSFLLGGSVVAGPAGKRLVSVTPTARPLIEALLEPAKRSPAARDDRAVA